MSSILTLQNAGNYSAILHSFDQSKVTPLSGLDNLVGYRVFGMQALIQKDQFEDGEPVVMFVAGSQLAPAFASYHCLYRHAELNREPSIAGYLDDNARIKALKLRGHRSDALVLSGYSLACVSASWFEDYPEGSKHAVEFDTVDGEQIVYKFIAEPPRSASQHSPQRTSLNHLVDLPEHPDTEQLLRFMAKASDDDLAALSKSYVFVSQKLHGTSVRFGRMPMPRKLSLLERIARRLGVRAIETEHKLVVGSRRVIKSIDGEADPNVKEHFYSDDLWTSVVQRKIREGSQVPNNFHLYGEIVGWDNEFRPIQSGYTYGCFPRPGNNELYLYRVAYTVNGKEYDLTPPQIELFCARYGWEPVPTLFQGVFADLMDFDNYTNQRFRDLGFGQALPLSNPYSVDEGVVFRVETATAPLMLKLKSPEFLQHESKLQDEGKGDIEDAA